MKVELTAKGRGAVLWRNRDWDASSNDEKDVLVYVDRNELEKPAGSDFPVLEGVEVEDMCYDLKLTNCDDIVSWLVMRKMLRPVRGK